LVEASGAVDGPGPMTLVRKKLSVTSHEAEEPLSKASSGNLEELRSDDYFDKEIGYRSIYCLTKLLRQSIDGSANLTPSLRIPKEIWDLTKHKIQAFPVKSSNFALLATKFDEVQNASESDTSALFDLSEMLDSIQNSLSQYLTYIHTIKISPKAPVSKFGKMGAQMRKYGHSIVKKATRATSTAHKAADESYLGLIKRILNSAEYFDSLERNAESDLYKDVLLRIREFFRDVFCSIIVTDIREVLKKYLKEESRAALA